MIACDVVYCKKGLEVDGNTGAKVRAQVANAVVQRQGKGIGGMMKRRLFMDSDIFPTETLLRKKSSTAMGFYQGIMSTSMKYYKRWQFNHGNGWILRVDDSYNTLYYLAAFEDGIEISLTVRSDERANFMKNQEIRDIHDQLELGTKYQEGYALRFAIESPGECKSVERFLKELMEERSKARQSGRTPIPVNRQGKTRKPKAPVAG
jgi:hypothetical protein